MSNSLPDFLPVLERWFGSEMAQIYGRLPDKGDGLLMGCPVWGERYVNRFGWYCLPSLLAPKNLAVLRDNCRLVLFTDKPSFPRLWEILRGLEAETGIEVILREIPDEIMDGVLNQPKGEPIDNKYWVLGVAGQLALQMAGRAGMNFHMLMPDHLYAEGYFPALLRLGERYEGIAQPGVSADVQKAHEAIYGFKQLDGSLAIPDRELGDIGRRFMHPQTSVNLFDAGALPNQLPLSHLWIWQGRDRLYLSCCHMNAAYLSSRLCALAPSRIPATMDAELPAFFPEKFYVPKADDGLTYIELSDGSKPHSSQKGNLEQFVACCWEKVRYSEAWMPFAEQLYEVPTHPQEIYTEEANVKQQHAWLLAQMHNEPLKAAGAYKLIQSLAFRQ